MAYRDIQKRRNNMREYRQTPMGRWVVYKDGANKRGIKWELTFEQFMIFWQKPCYYCGDEIKTIGLDRIDNTKGYSIDNVVSCCSICNYMKLNNSQDEFIEHCKKIVKFIN